MCNLTYFLSLRGNTPAHEGKKLSATACGALVEPALATGISTPIPLAGSFKLMEDMRNRAACGTCLGVQPAAHSGLTAGILLLKTIEKLDVTVVRGSCRGRIRYQVSGLV